MCFPNQVPMVVVLLCLTSRPWRAARAMLDCQQLQWQCLEANCRLPPPVFDWLVARSLALPVNEQLHLLIERREVIWQRLQQHQTLVTPVTEAPSIAPAANAAPVTTAEVPSVTPAANAAPSVAPAANAAPTVAIQNLRTKKRGALARLVSAGAGAGAAHRAGAGAAHARAHAGLVRPGRADASSLSRRAGGWWRARCGHRAGLPVDGRGGVAHRRAREGRRCASCGMLWSGARCASR
jgi:hypothetical protein